MKLYTRSGVFSLHETERALALGGAPLASFRRRAAIAIDFLLIAFIWIPLKAGDSDASAFGSPPALPEARKASRPAFAASPNAHPAKRQR